MTDSVQPQQKQLDWNLDYLKKPAGQLRAAQGVLSLAALISSVEGRCIGGYGYFMFLITITMVEAIVIIIAFVLQLDKKVKHFLNIPFTLLWNDGISLILYFVACILAMLSIGRCPYRIAARIMAALFLISIFLVYIGLCYADIKWFQAESSAKETSTNGSTTVTESSPTVLT